MGSPAATNEDLMALFTQDIFEDRFSMTLEAEEVARFDSVLTYVDGFVASFVRGRYGWPLDPNPPEIVSAALDIIRDELITKPTRKPVQTSKDRREAAEAFLLRVSRGHAALDVGETEATAISVVTVAYEPLVFTDELLAKMP